MKKTKFFFTSLFTLLVIISSCKQEDSITDPTSNNAAVKLKLNAVFGELPLLINQNYTNAAGDVVQFSEAKFYLSELALVDTLGNLLPARNHKITLVDFGTSQNSSVSIDFDAKPNLYRGITFSIGVPIEENHKDASTQPAPLNLDAGMFWSWNSGYIFNKIEGRFDSAGTSRNFVYHIGTDNRKLTVQLATLVGANRTTFVVSSDETNEFIVNVDYAKIFSTGLVSGAPIRLVQNTNEREAHGGGLADRIFLNTQTMISRRAN